MITKHSLVSILIVAYNAEEFIWQTILSCLNQNYPALEILILDNGSQDDTIKAVRSIKNEKIKLFLSPQNAGPYAGLNFLLERAEGNYIAIQDHDDLWFPEKIEKQIDFLEGNREYVACGTNNINFYEARHFFIVNKKPFISDYVPHATLMFRRNNLRYEVSHSLADEHFQKIALRSLGKIFLVPEPLSIHRIRSGNNNLSSRRFALSRKYAQDFFNINGFNFGSLKYFLTSMTLKMLSFRIRFILEKNVLKRSCQKFSLAEFKERYPAMAIYF